jgi:hypothetical protein
MQAYTFRSLARVKRIIEVGGDPPPRFFVDPKTVKVETE